MSGFIVVKKSILEDVQDGLIEAFNNAADSRRKDLGKSRDMADLAERILKYEQEIIAKRLRPVNQSALNDVQSKLLEEFNRTKQSQDHSVIPALADQILAYEKLLDNVREASFPAQPATGGPASSLEIRLRGFGR